MEVVGSFTRPDHVDAASSRTGEPVRPSRPNPKNAAYIASIAGEEIVDQDGRTWMVKKLQASWSQPQNPASPSP
jgi:hypothetical protein